MHSDLFAGTGVVQRCTVASCGSADAGFTMYAAILALVCSHIRSDRCAMRVAPPRQSYWTLCFDSTAVADTSTGLQCATADGCAFGVVVLGQNAAMTVGPPIAGMLRDTSGDYGAVRSLSHLSQNREPEINH